MSQEASCRSLVAVLGCAAALLSVVPLPAAGSVAEIRERGELVMICFPHQEGVFERVNVKLGPMPALGPAEHFEGIDVDLMRAFAEELGVRLMIRPVGKAGYDELIPDLLAGKGDVIASAFTVTSERSKRVDFSDPYFRVHRVVIGPAGNLPESIEDLAGRTAVTVTGSSNHRQLQELDVELAGILEVDFLVGSFAAISEGEADFTLLDSVAIRRLDIGDDLEVAFEIPGEEFYAFAVPPGSDLREPLNRFLAKMKASGELDEILERHFPPDPESQAVHK